MWYRDYTLVQDRLQEIERHVREANLLTLMKAGPHANQHRSSIRIATASAVRRLGHAAIGLSDRIDACAAETDVYAPRRGPAFR